MVETRVKKQMITASPRPTFAVCTLWKHQKFLKGQIVCQRLHSNAAYKYSYAVCRSELVKKWSTLLWAHGCGLYACVYIAVACMHNLVHILRINMPRICTLVHIQCIYMYVNSKYVGIVDVCLWCVVGVLFEATEVATEQEPLPSSHEVYTWTTGYSPVWLCYIESQICLHVGRHISCLVICSVSGFLYV